MSRVFNLGDFRTYPGAKVFSGRPRGEAVRKQMGLDKLDASSEDVIIQIPNDTYSFNMSFFLGLCTDSVRKYGPEKFSMKYHFEGPKVCLNDLPTYLDQAMKQSSILHSVRQATERK